MKWMERRTKIWNESRWTVVEIACINGMKGQHRTNARKPCENGSFTRANVRWMYRFAQKRKKNNLHCVLSWFGPLFVVELRSFLSEHWVSKRKWARNRKRARAYESVTISSVIFAFPLIFYPIFVNLFRFNAVVCGFCVMRSVFRLLSRNM